MKLAIVSTHPIQYNAPFFRLLAQQPNLELCVFYTWEQANSGPKFDPGFGRTVSWDLPLLEGYEYRFVKNISQKPGSHHFRGIVNPTLNQEIESWGPNLVLVYGWSFQGHLNCLRYFHGKIPVWFRGDSTLLNERQGIRKLLRRTFLKWVYSHVDLALYVGANNKLYYQKHGLKPHQLAYVPHAIDNNRFQNHSEEYEQRAISWRKELGIGPENIVVLFAGKLEPRKNPAFIPEMAKYVTNAQVRFLIVGEGPLESIILDWMDVDSRVIRLGFQNQIQMPVVYRLGDIFLLPSQSETWGLGVNEAMACKRPVLISDRCGCAPDLVKNGQNGYIFNYASPTDAAKKLEQMLSDTQARLNMGEKSLEHISAYSLEVEVDKFMSHLEESALK